MFREECVAFVNSEALLPFEVFEQEADGRQIGLRERQQQVGNAVLLGGAVREICKGKKKM